MVTQPRSIGALLSWAESRCASRWAEFEAVCHHTFERVMDGFITQGLGDEHFHSVTGYAHHDLGRHITDAVFAYALQAEAAVVRMQFVSGTHAIACALKGVLKPGQTLLSLTGAPYDTLEEVIGLRGQSRQSLIQQGINYRQINLFDTFNGTAAFDAEQTQAIQWANVIFIQRSRGYSLRPSLSQADLAMIIPELKRINPHAVVVVDNCYGEFVFDNEPTTAGADLIVGSLIKNPGGGIALTGGYIAGKEKWVDSAADVLTAPGIGRDGGYTFEATRTLMQGLYLAPTVVKEALKSMSLFATVFQELGYPVFPSADVRPSDIIQVIHLGQAEKVLAFCRALQACSPVGAKLTPVPAVTPGYADPVVMAGGTFIFGSTIELSADAPMREPYAVFLQGGLTYTHARLALRRILQSLGYSA